LNLVINIKTPQYNFEQTEIFEMYDKLLKKFLKLEPLLYPGFAFSWLELIFNRQFMPIILQSSKYWENYHLLLKALFRYFNRIHKDSPTSLNSPCMKEFYMGTLRVLLVILHDWPEFLMQYAYSFCEEIPETFFQIKNIVLSAFNKGMKYPDPF